MGRRYFCEYCDKSFIDEIEARKKHLNSATHQKLRKDHYLSCRDTKTILTEEIVKRPCSRYMSNGECQFLNNCKYTHYTQEELWQLKLEIDAAEQKHKELEKQQMNLPTVKSWLKKYNQKKSTNKNILSVKTDIEEPNIWWHYPEKLELVPDLPPSLRKFRFEQFQDSNYETWGK